MTSMVYGPGNKQLSGSSAKTEYLWLDSQLMAQYTQTGSNATNQMMFLYDASRDLFGFTYEGVEYWYLRNIQGDIIGITDTAGRIRAEYGYDTWGKPVSIKGYDASGGEVSVTANHIGYRNPSGQRNRSGRAFYT